MMELDHNNELKYRADFILNYYFLDRNGSLDGRIQEWLCCGALTGAKDDALKEIWDTRVKWDEPDEYAYKSLEELRERLGFTSKERHRFKTLLRVSAVVAVFALLTFATLIMADKKTIVDDLRNAVAEEMTYTTVEVDGIARKYVILPDGSEIWVGKNSKIVYPDRFDAERSVHLTGNAYFSVVNKDATPFRVEGKNLKVTVLGTEFEVNVPEAGEKTEVTLVKGSVEVQLQDNAEPLLLKPNEKLSYDSSDGVVIIGEIHEDEIAPWKEVRLDFDNTPLLDALRMISTYYGITMAIEGTSPLNGKITGRFAEDELLEEVLFVVGKVSCMFDYEIEGECVRLIWR